MNQKRQQEKQKQEQCLFTPNGNNKIIINGVIGLNATESTQIEEKEEKQVLFDKTIEFEDYDDISEIGDNNSGCLDDSSFSSLPTCPDCDSELTKIYEDENYHYSYDNVEWHYFCDNCGLQISRNSAFAIMLAEEDDNIDKHSNYSFRNEGSDQSLHW